jgi:phosphoribosylanthranilate isomerase
MRVRVKICGLTSPDAVDAAVAAGADAVGFVLAESPRRVSPDVAARLAERVPPFVTRVAVFRHPSVEEIAACLDEFEPDLLQLEPASMGVVPARQQSRVIPVLHDSDDLLDEIAGAGARVHLEGPGRGGRGIPVDRTRAREAAGRCQLVLAGGLNPGNVADAIRDVRPFAVDVSSGVESAPGVKDPALIKEFIDAVRSA